MKKGGGGRSFPVLAGGGRHDLGGYASSARSFKRAGPSRASGLARRCNGKLHITRHRTVRTLVHVATPVLGCDVGSTPTYRLPPRRRNTRGVFEQPDQRDYSSILRKCGRAAADREFRWRGRAAPRRKARIPWSAPSCKASQTHLMQRSKRRPRRHGPASILAAAPEGDHRSSLLSASPPISPAPVGDRGR